MSLAALGCNPDLRSTTAQFETGTLGYSPDNQICRYVQAGGVITANRAVRIRADQAVLSDAASDQVGDDLGVATAAFADNEYGFVVVAGTVAARFEANVTAGHGVTLHATDGSLTSAADSWFTGIRVKTARTGAGNTDVILSFPSQVATS